MHKCPRGVCVSFLLLSKPYTVVTAWRYEGSAVDVPWRSLGGMLFEMGACWCSVYVGEEEEEEGLERQGHREQAPGETEAVQWGRGAMLTFALEEGGGGDVGAVLEAACALAGGPDDCFGKNIPSLFFPTRFLQSPPASSWGRDACAFYSSYYATAVAWCLKQSLGFAAGCGRSNPDLPSWLRQSVNTVRAASRGDLWLLCLIRGYP